MNLKGSNHLTLTRFNFDWFALDDVEFLLVQTVNKIKIKLKNQRRK